MSSYKTILNDAQSDGLIDQSQYDGLVERFDKSVTTSSEPSGSSTDLPLALERDLEKPIHMDAPTAVPETEAPRLIRGFHDVLITFGVVIALFGLGATFGNVAVMVVTWILAEILVKRQRLALPAVVLTLSYLLALGSLITPYFLDRSFAYPAELILVMATAIFPIALVPFYWRFRVPIALSMMILSVVLFAISAALLWVSYITDIENLFENSPYLFNVVGFVGAFILFFTAMWFDSKDRTREKRWSDVAFWLHLITAPALLYSILSLVLYQNAGAFWWTETPDFRDAAVVIACVLAMMFVGLVIDRRAFVTAGLISLVIAVGVLFEYADITWGDTAGVTLLVVGLLVLTFGVGWQFSRRYVLKILPAFIVENVPIVR